jgi:hypothetical protein
VSFKKLTLIITVVSVALLLIYDAIAIYFGGTEASISSLVITASYKQPLIPLLVGILIGHLFWRMKGNNDTRELGLDEKHK